VEKEVLYLSNALKGLELWRNSFHNVLLLDNQQYELREDTHESLETMYERINKDVAKRLTLLLTAGAAKHPPQEVFDASDIKATMQDSGDISTVGYRGERIKLRTQFWKRGIEPESTRLEEIIKESLSQNRLTFPCDISDSKAAALVTHGRPKHLFTQAIVAGKAYLEQKMRIGEVRYGDYPDTRTAELGAVTLISGITDSSRLEQMRKRIAEVT
jgi:cell division GTPase FtsZ